MVNLVQPVETPACHAAAIKLFHPLGPSPAIAVSYHQCSKNRAMSRMDTGCVDDGPVKALT